MRVFVVLLPAAVVSLALAGGCSANSTGPVDEIDGSGVILPGGDASGPEGSGEGGSAVTSTTMRLAHASPDLGPIDFCWRPTGTASFTGPVLGDDVTPLEGGAMQDAAASADALPYAGAEGGEVAETGEASAVLDAAAGPDASPEATADGRSEATAPDAVATLDALAEAQSYDGPADGLVDATEQPEAGLAELAFGAMTPYVTLPTSGTFDIAVVAAGQTSCLQPQPRLIGRVTLDPGRRSTVVVMGRPGDDAGPSALTMAAFVDAPAEALSTRVRFIHAALGSTQEPAAPALSVRTGARLLAAEVDPGMAADASTSPAVDALGYTTLDPMAGMASLDFASVGDAAAAQWMTPPTALGLDLGSTHTGIIVTLGQGALGVAWCGDVGDAGGRTACTLIAAPP